MRKFLSLLVALATVTMAWAAQGGTLTSSKTPIDPTQTVTLTYDGTGTNFANWEPSCFIHAWLVAADGQTLSKSYSTDWASCNGDGDYASLASKLKMTYSGTKGKYTISMNIKEFFNVADADLPKIGKLGVIVRAQYEGDNNKTNDMFVNVAYTAPASKVTYTALTKAPTTGNWAGQYLIVWADNKAHATVSGKDLAATSDVLTITDGEIEINSTDKYYVTVELMQGGYSIKLPSGKYLSVNANDNKVAEVNNAYAFNFEYTASGVKIFGKDTQGNVRYVFNNGTYYRSYKWNDSYKLPTLYRTGDEAPALQTLYFVNTLDWAKVNAFVWPATGDAYKAWPGEAAVKTGEKALEKDIYSYTFPATFVNAIFNNGTAQTTDLKWDKAKPYFVPGDADGEGKFTGTWYASTSEIPVPCEDGPYSLLVNGTDTIKSVKGDEFDGYTQYVVYASLTKNDKIQVLNESCGALWMPAIEEGGASAHFKKGENDATIDSTGCFDLYIKMKAGEDKVYIGYGICEGDSVAPCLDGPYSLLVNGTDTIKSVKGDEFDGYTQYVVYASLTKNDKIQVLNESCGALWMPAIEEGGASAHFKKGENDATIDSTGCFDLYIKMKAGEDKVYIGYGICEGDSVAPCLDGPYSLLVNGTDTIKSVKGDEFDGYTQYVVYASLTKNDKIQVLNESCGALWMPAIEEGGASAHFKKGENDATIDSTGCFDLYIKMKAGEDKVYIGYGICEGDSVAPCLDGPYSLLVNGTDTIKSVKGDEFDGYTQYVVYASLTKNDKIQVLNESCGALWMPAIEEGGASAHFKKGENDATIDSTGCFDLYIKMKAGEDKVYIGYGICEGDSVAPCLDGPYSLLVNGTDTIKSVKGDEFDGYTQYVVYASLTKNDKIQVLNESCGALWMPAIEEGGASAHFKKGENDATIDSTGCFDLYIKMKAGEDKVYIGYGICEGDSVAPCLDGPYSLLVNGTDTIKSVKGDEFDGYTQYVVYASLTKNDKIQVLNESCGALWMPAIEEGGASAHFKKGENDATIDSTGCFDLYIKMKAGEDKVYIGYGICEGDSVAPCLDGPYGFIVNGTDTLKAVALEEADAQGRKQYLIDSVALKANDKFVVANLSCDSKWVMDVEEYGAYANFTKGEDAYTVKVDGMYAFYIKMSLEAGDVMYIGEIKDEPQPQPCQDGPYGFIVNGTDTLKAVALEEADAQGRKQYLIDSVALKANDKFVVANLSCDSKWVMDVEEYGAYANFTKGEDAYTVKVDGMYAFYIKMSLEAGDIMYIGEIKDEPVIGDKFYMKNNWNAGVDWTWKEMTKDGDNFKLENVVFGGSGVNYNTSETDEGAAWVEVADILGDKIAAKDTVTFVLNPTAKTVTATIVGKYIPTGDVQYFMKNNWNAGADWTWKEMTKDGDNYKLENVVYGGTGVNYNTEATDANATWVAEEDILGDKIAAKDTVTLTLDPVAATVTAKLIGKYQEGTEPENAYGLMINGTTFVKAELNPATANEYMALGVELTAGQTFQVFDKANNVGWVIANWNEGSYQFTIENDKYVVTETAKYDFYFKMEYGNDYIYVAKQGEPTTPTVEVWGDMNDWAYGLPMTLSEDKTKATISANIDPDTYEFKIMVNGEWRSNAQTFTRQNNSAVGITMNENDNMKFVADIKGDYTVTWIFATNELSIVYPTSTAIENLIAPANELRKVMIDGKLYILRDGKVYSVQGQLIR